MINYLYNDFKGVKHMNKKAQKIAAWTMLILMVGSVVVGILAYLL